MKAVCDVSSIKKARYTLQVIAVKLMKTLKDAHESSGFAVTVFTWASSQLDNPMFAYWYHVMEHIKNVFLLIRSFREANIDLLIVALEEIVPLFFALHHLNYTRWVSVSIQDLNDLPLELPSLYKKLKQEHFV